MRLSRLEVLSQEEIERIHQCSLSILHEVGVLVESEAARKILLEKGGKPGPREGVISLPPELVEQSLKSLPGQIPLYDRNGNLAFILGDGGMYCEKQVCAHHAKKHRKSRP